MQDVTLTQDIYPHSEGDVIRVDDTSAARIVEAGAGRIASAEHAEHAESDKAAKPPRAAQTVTMVAPADK